MESFIKPDQIEATGTVAGAVLTAMVKSPRNRTHIVLYVGTKPESSAYSVHTVEHNETSLCDGSYGMSFQDAMIVLARRATNQANIFLND